MLMQFYKVQKVIYLFCQTFDNIGIHMSYFFSAENFCHGRLLISLPICFRICVHQVFSFFLQIEKRPVGKLIILINSVFLPYSQLGLVTMVDCVCTNILSEVVQVICLPWTSDTDRIAVSTCSPNLGEIFYALSMSWCNSWSSEILVKQLLWRCQYC